MIAVKCDTPNMPRFEIVNCCCCCVGLVDGTRCCCCCCCYRTVPPWYSFGLSLPSRARDANDRIVSLISVTPRYNSSLAVVVVVVVVVVE
jgi:hypothetical protein